MAFHPEKCSAIRVTRARNPITANYSPKGHTLQLDDSTRYRGVELQANMSWNKHINQTVRKANSTLGFLRRNLKVSNEQTKTAAYFSMVRPVLEYCSTVWSPHTKSYTHKVEMVQRRAARYVTNRYRNTSSVTNMLDHLDWESLESRRTKHQLAMLFKIIHGLVDITAGDYLTPTTTLGLHGPLTLESSYRSLFQQIYTSIASSQEQSGPGTPYLLLLQRLPDWYNSNGSCQTVHLTSQPMQVHPNDTLKLCWQGLHEPWYRHGSQTG